MKHIPRHTKSIEFEFLTNGLILFRATFPVKNKPTVPYSEWYKKAKLAVASSNEIPVWKIKATHKTIDSVYFDRILFEWPGGFAIDLPDDVTNRDYDIVLHYLEGIKMSLSK
jgi:hypothetical protein